MRPILCASLTALAVLAACSGSPAPRDQAQAQISVTPQVAAVDAPDVHRLLKLSDNIYTGAAPSGRQTYAALVELGVRTLVGVDSARPDVEGAAAYGLRYIHIPIGYDEISTEAQLSIVAAMEAKDGPYYFHCHHGKHRGPAAAAVALRADSGCSGRVAREVLVMAETSPDYPGLWRDVQGWMAPAADAPRPQLRSVSEVGSFEGAMARIDRTWDHIELIRNANWQTPEDHPDLVPAQEAALLAQDMATCLSRPPAELRQDADLLQRLRDAVEQTEALQKGLEAQTEEQLVGLEELEQRYDEVKRSCKSCHRNYRNT